jgi:hypothetical protein
MKTSIEITNGPSREELFDGLRLFAEKRLIAFSIKKDETEKYVAVIINSIEAEDGSGHSWNLTFSINELCLSETFFVNKSVKKESGVIAKEIQFDGFKQLAEENYLLQEFKKNQIIVKAYYSTKTRKGTITVE